MEIRTSVIGRVSPGHSPLVPAMISSQPPDPPDARQARIRADRRRTGIGALLALALIPFLLAVTACLKEPIGDPEKSVVDPNLTGAWLEKRTNAELDRVWIFQPFDGRAYQVGVFELEKTDHVLAPATNATAESRSESTFMAYKGWITRIGGKRFLCLGASFELSTEFGMKPGYWIGIQLPDSIAGDSFTFQMVDGEKTGKTTREIEDYIRRNVGKNELLTSDNFLLRRVDRKDYDALSKRLSKAGFSQR